MKAPLTLLPVLALVPTALTFAYPPPNAYSAFEISETKTVISNKDGQTEAATTGFRRFFDNLDENHPDYTDSVFDAIEASFKEQVRNVESHLEQVRAFQEELYTRMTEFIAVGEMGNMLGFDEAMPFWIGGQGEQKAAEVEGAKKVAVKENPLDRVEGDYGSDDDLNFERAGLFGEEAWDVERWFKTEEPQLPIDPSYLSTLNEQAGQEEIQSSFVRDENSTLLDLIKESHHASEFYDFIKDYPDIVNQLKDTSANTTVFVPNNHAFKRLLRHKKKEDIPKEIIEKVLTYHLAPGCIDTSSLRWKNTIESSLRNDLLGENEHQRLRLGLCPKHGLTVNLYARIIMADIPAKNGVIHAINNVLLPPPDMRTLLQLFPAKFSTTLYALAKTDLLSTLDDGPNTIFAPSNKAWERIPAEITAFLFSERGKKYLQALMKYHIVPKQILYSDARIKAEEKVGRLPGGYTHLELDTLLTPEAEKGSNSGMLHADIVRFPKMLSFRVNGRSEIVLSNGLAKDGVIHVPNHIIMPTCEELHKAEAGMGRNQKVLGVDGEKRSPCENLNATMEGTTLEQFTGFWDRYMRY